MKQTRYIFTRQRLNEEEWKSKGDFLYEFKIHFALLQFEKTWKLNQCFDYNPYCWGSKQPRTTRSVRHPWVTQRKNKRNIHHDQCCQMHSERRRWSQMSVEPARSGRRCPAGRRKRPDPAGQRSAAGNRRGRRHGGPTCLKEARLQGQKHLPVRGVAILQVYVHHLCWNLLSESELSRRTKTRDGKDCTSACDVHSQTHKNQLTISILTVSIVNHYLVGIKKFRPTKASWKQRVSCHVQWPVVNRSSGKISISFWMFGKSKTKTVQCSEFEMEQHKCILFLRGRNAQKSSRVMLNGSDVVMLVALTTNSAIVKGNCLTVATNTADWSKKGVMTWSEVLLVSAKRIIEWFCLFQMNWGVGGGEFKHDDWNRQCQPQHQNLYAHLDFSSLKVILPFQTFFKLFQTHWTKLTKSRIYHWEYFCARGLKST